AQIEGSKVFSKGLMRKYGIPTADYESFSDSEKAIDYIKTKNQYPIVIKADGLALGKGVLICKRESEAVAAVRDMLVGGRFGASGRTVVIEEFMTGPEVSVLAFTDGKTMVPMVSSMDHKRALDGDCGFNTGGMGTIAPNPHYTEAIAQTCMETIFIPTMNAMNTEGTPFKGCLYFGLMLTPNGPRVIEYNCRFGDPETQVVLPLLESDLLDIMEAVAHERLADAAVRFGKGAAACVVLASGGYPLKYETGFVIDGLKNGQIDNPTTDYAETIIYHAGTKLADGKLLTAGGRVLGVTAKADNLQQAVNAAYAAADKIHFEDMHRRGDIGAAAGIKHREGK
ncbi:MAG: phosphoribosylamine--glycine ligase, partial [Angelakisella sp.]